MASSDNLLVITIIIIAVILLIAGSCFLCQRMYVSFWRTNRKLSLRVTAAATAASRQRNTSTTGNVGTSWNGGESGGGNSVYTIPVEDSEGNTSFIVVQTCQSRPIFIEPLCEEPPPSYEDCVKTKPINYTVLPIIHV